jgi:lysozyme
MFNNRKELLLVMKTNQAGIELIKKFEGFSSHAYKCPANILTIGYGFTKGVKEDDCITKEDAEKRLKLELMHFEKCVTEFVHRDLTSNQFSALVCFVYNIGEGNFKASTMLKLLNSGAKPETVANEFSRWIHAGGKVLNGLIARRKAEAELFLA